MNMKLLVLAAMFTLLIIACNEGNESNPVNNPSDSSNVYKLLAYYPFDGNANDSLGNYNGINNGANLTGDRFNNPNAAYEFHGENSYIEVPFPDAFNFEGNFSICAWINPNTLSAKANGTHIDIITKWGPNGPAQASYLFGITTSGEMEYWANDGSSHSFIVGNAPLNDGTWYHVALIYFKISINSGLAVIFVDGEPYVNGEVHHPQTSDLNLYFGSRSDHTSNYAGIIDDIRIYNRALNFAEIDAFADDK
jgi:concanavalin A-like lectin/glucanase superfamily protein